MTIRLLCGDALEQLRLLEENDVDAVVTDPPYGIGFMNKGWDRPTGEEWGYWAGSGKRPTLREACAFQDWSRSWATESLRVAKPGAHLLAFGGTRTFHRLACAIEDAGWEIRDCLMWVYGSGFPKSLNLSKAIDKAAGLTRLRIPGGVGSCNTESLGKFKPGEAISDEPISDEAIKWQGWGTALKPAWEPIVLARKPLEGTVAENVQKWGAGALNIDGSRIATVDVGGRAGGRRPSTHEGYQRPNSTMYQDKTEWVLPTAGRWPANLIHDGSDEVVGMFPDRDGMRTQTDLKTTPSNYFGVDKHPGVRQGRNDSGSAARFFYCAKASRAEREGSNHPTVKPLALMRYLCRLVTPPGGTVLDPFMGSGSTGKAALLEGFGFIGIDNVPEYVEVARRRIEGTAPLFAEEER